MIGPPLRWVRLTREEGVPWSGDALVRVPGVLELPELGLWVESKVTCASGGAEEPRPHVCLSRLGGLWDGASVRRPSAPGRQGRLVLSCLASASSWAPRVLGLCLCPSASCSDFSVGFVVLPAGRPAVDGVLRASF